MLQRHQRGGRRFHGGAAHHGDLYRFANKAAVSHPLSGNFAYKGAALRQNLHQTRFRQLNKRFAHRLT